MFFILIISKKVIFEPIHAVKTSRKLNDLKHYAREVYLSNVFATKPGIKWLCMVQLVLGQEKISSKVSELAALPAIEIRQTEKHIYLQFLDSGCSKTRTNHIF